MKRIATVWCLTLAVCAGAARIAIAEGVGEVGATPDPGTGVFGDVKVRGDYAYLACGDYGLAIATVTNPISPSIFKYVDTPGSAVALDVLGNYAYVADQTGGVAIVDIAAPSTAYKVKSFTVGLSSGGQPYYVQDVTVLSVGGHTYLGIAAGVNFVAVDVSFPATPSILYTNTMSGANSVKGVRAWGSRIWAACDDDGLRGYEFSGAPVSGKPALTAQFPVAQWGGTTGGALELDFDTARSLAFVARGNGGVAVIDLSDTNNLEMVSSQPLWGWTSRVAVNGTNVYAVSQVPGEDAYSLYGMSAANPANLSTWWIYESHLASESEGWFMGMDVAAPYLYVAMYEQGMYVFPLGTPVFVNDGFADLFPSLRMWTGGNIAWTAETNDVYSAPAALMSGTVAGHNYSSWVETRVRGPGTLHYQWKQTGEGPFFMVRVDGIDDGGYTQDLGWRFNAINIDPGWHLVRWTYKESFSPNDWSVALLDNVTWVPNGPGSASLGAAADAEALLWTTGGHTNWSGQTAITHDHVDALQSGVLASDQTNWVETTVTGPGALKFWWKVASDDTTFYDNFAKEFDDMGDRGVFLFDGVPLLSVMGEMNWKLQRFLIPKGTHALRWRFGRDSLSSIGADALWVDQVVFEPGRFPGIQLKGLLEYGDVAVGAKKTKKLSVINPGYGSMHVKSVRCPPGFSAWPQQFTVLAGQTQKVSVAFAPTALGVVRGTVTVNSDARAGVNTKELMGEGNGPGTIRMAAASVQVLEGYTQEIRVRRVRGDMGGVSVNYSTLDGTAKAGKDYTAVSGTLWWFYGDSDEQIIEVPIRADARAEGDETFQVILSSPSNGARLGTPSRTTVTIR